MSKKKPAENPGRKRDRGETRVFNFEMSLELFEAFERCAEKEDRKKNAILRRALEDYLRRAGEWPVDVADQ